MYTYIRTHTHTHIYIYIEREREREREREYEAQLVIFVQFRGIPLTRLLVVLLHKPTPAPLFKASFSSSNHQPLNI